MFRISLSCCRTTGDSRTCPGTQHGHRRKGGVRILKLSFRRPCPLLDWRKSGLPGSPDENNDYGVHMLTMPLFCFLLPPPGRA